MPALTLNPWEHLFASVTGRVYHAGRPLAPSKSRYTIGLIRTGGALEDKPVFSLTELREWLEERGVKRSRKALESRALRGTLGHKIGNQYVVALPQAKALLEALRQGDS